MRWVREERESVRVRYEMGERGEGERREREERENVRERGRRKLGLVRHYKKI